MLLKFFKRTLPLVLSSVILIALLLWLKSFISPSLSPVQFSQNQMPAYAFLHNLLVNRLFISKLISFTLMLITSLYLIQLNSKHILIKNRSYLPALIYILLTSSFISIQGINPTVFAAFFLVVTIDHLFLSYEKHRPYHNFFMAGFFIGIATLFYLPSSVFLALAFAAILLTRPFNLRDWIVTISGLVTPWYFVFLYHYLVNDNLNAVPQLISSTWNSPDKFTPTGITFYIFLGINSIAVLISLVSLLRLLPTQKINIRKFHGILIWFTILSALLVAHPQIRSVEVVYIIAIPFSILYSHFLSFSKNRFWPDFFLSAILVLSILMQFLA